ncbi:MAG: hypothetical protein HUU57_13080 [Bdellovibrio sp.]|nr:hypothetical protein [Bdellovibrio sp.]
MKTVFSFFVTILVSTNAFTQTSAELTCRAQAKEIAMQTYSSCITQARNSHVEEVRKNYQKELADLKSKYDKELKKLSGSKAQAPAAKIKQTPASRPVKGIAKELPGKASVSSTDAAPVQTVTEGTKVVSVSSEAASDLEKEAEDAEQVEIIEMPVE